MNDPSLLLETLLDHYDRQTKERGEDYFKEGRSRILQVSRAPRSVEIQAEVEGSGSQTYQHQLTVSFSSQEPTVAVSRCSCPIRFFCKHGVATILQAFQEDPGIFFSDSRARGDFKRPSVKEEPPKNTPSRSLPSGAVPPSVPLSFALQEWMKGTPSGPPPYAADPHLEKRVLLLEFTCQKGPRFSTPQYILASGVPKGDGDRWTHWKAFNDWEFSKITLLNDPWMQAMLPKLSLAQALRGGLEKQKCVGTDFAEIFLEAAKAGRLLTPGKFRQRIQVGSPQKLHLQWIPESAGDLLSGYRFDLPGLELIPLAKPLYWNPSKQVIGEVDAPLTGERLQAWLQIPRVRSHETGAVAQKIVSDFPDFIPPQEIKVHTMEPAEKKGFIRLTKDARYGDEEGIAKVHFEYDSIPVAPHGNAEWITQNTAQGFQRFQRDFAWEKKLIRELEKQGFNNLSIYATENESTSRYEPDLDHLPDFDAGDWGEEEGDSLHEPEEIYFWKEFFDQKKKILEKKGWVITVDPSFPFRSVEIESWYSNLEPTEKAAEWFSFDLGIFVDGEKISIIPLVMRWLRSFRSAGDVREYLVQRDQKKVSLRLEDGRQLLIPTSRIFQICEVFVEVFDREHSGDSLTLSRLSAAMTQEVLKEWEMPWKPSASLDHLRTSLQEALKPSPISKISKLQATLRPYQQEGIGWLQALSNGSLGGILADDMGLGKTIQTLGWISQAVKENRKGGTVLVVAPKSLMANWMAEAERFVPHLRVHLSHGKDRLQDEKALERAHIVLTTYMLLIQDAELLQKVHFRAIFLDEAQAIKNAKSQYFEKASSLRSNSRFCLTGTPLENHLGELWALFQFVNPGYLGSERQFKKLFRNPIEKESDNMRLEALKRRIRPFLLRRTKDLVAKELPPKTEQIQRVILESDQRDLYETLRVMMDKRIRDEIKKKGFARSQITILDALLKLRQCCCDPRLLKIDAAKKVKTSAKLDHLFELIPEMVQEGRRILLFSQFTTMLQLIENRVIDEKIPYLKLTGETENRGELVKKFQTGKIPFFLLSLKAGGSGLNLTAADTVIHYDPWWNPAVENQATDRAHRIGQEKPVFIHKLITEGTVEEKILKLQEKKRALAGGILEGKGLEKEQFSENDLDFLLAPIGEIAKKKD
jgi:SNF2 family DNA or RNA helicase